MGTISTVLKISADARSAVSGLKPLQASLEGAEKAAHGTEQALGGLDKPVTVRLNDQAIDTARKEIARLRAQMRQDLSVDVTADTRESQRRIAQLQRSIRTLDAETVTVPVDVTGVQEAETGLHGISGSIKGLGGLIGGAAVGKWLSDGALAASRFETNMRAVNTVLGATTKTGIETWIADNADALNLSQAAASDAARSLSLYGKAFEGAGGNAEEFVTKLIEVAANAAAFSGADPGEAVAAIGAAMRGEFDSLETFGINLTATGIQAQAMKDGLVDANGAMDAGQKATATYNAILAQSEPLMGSVGRNADTLGGKVQDLGQSSEDLASSLGEALGPALTDMASGLAEMAGGTTDVINKWNELRSDIEKGADDGKNNVKDLVDFGTGSLWNMGKVWVRTGKQAFGFGEETKDAGDKTEEAGDQMEHTSVQVHDYGADLEGMAQKTEDATKRLADLVDGLTTLRNGFIDTRTHVVDYQGAIDDLAESLGKGKTFSPDVEAGRENWDNLVAVATTASEVVKDTWSRDGAEAAEAVFRAQRRGLVKLLTDAGIAAPRAWKLVDDVFKRPHEMSVELNEADRARLQRRLAKLQEQKTKILASVEIPESNARNQARIAARSIADKIRPIDAKIRAVTEKLQPVKDDLDKAAKEREAPIKPIIDPSSLSSATSTLSMLTATETKTIKVHMEENPTGDTLDPTTVRNFLATPSAPTVVIGGNKEPTQLAPRRTPVKVYLDGQEIASHIDLNAQRFGPPATVRRRA